MDDDWPVALVIIAIIILILGIIGTVLYYNIVKLEHQTERLETLNGVDRCLYLCGDVNSGQYDSRVACYEKCEDNYVNLETLKLVQNG